MPRAAPPHRATETDRQVITVGRQLLAIYVALSTLLFVWMGVLVLRDGQAGFLYLQGQAEPSSVALRFATFLTGWIAAGGLLVLTQVPDFARRHAALLAVVALVFFEYLILLREPHPVREGDFSAYFDAARSYRNGAAINVGVPRLYLYPPLLATILQPLVPLGLMPVLGAFKFGSQLALGVVLALLHPALRRYGYGKEGGALAMLVLFAANAPLHHNFVYSQVNVYVLVCMLTSLVAYPRFRALSAAALAIGVHLKVYPIMLALPFLIARDWKWWAWFAGVGLGIVFLTSMVNDAGYYLAFLDAIRTLREEGLRTSAIDSLVYNTMRLTGLDAWWLERPLANVLRLSLGGWSVYVSWRYMTVRDGHGMPATTTTMIARGFAALPLAMLVMSPSQWPHHFVLLIPSMLMLLPQVKGARDTLLFATSWFLIFVFPVNEVYPFPYLRLAALLTLVAITGRAARRGSVSPSDWFEAMQRRLAPLG